MHLYQAYQSAVYAAQDEESKDSRMQEMRYRKGNILRECLVSEKVRMQTLGFASMDPEQIRGEAEQDRGPW